MDLQPAKGRPLSGGKLGRGCDAAAQDGARVRETGACPHRATHAPADLRPGLFVRAKCIRSGCWLVRAADGVHFAHTKLSRARRRTKQSNRAPVSRSGEQKSANFSRPLVSVCSSLEPIQLNPRPFVRPPSAPTQEQRERERERERKRARLFGC